MDLFTYLMAKKGHNTHKDLFSYLLGKKASGGSGTYTTFSGTSLNISNTLKAKIKNFMLNSTELTQDGTPSPSSPVDVNVITGSNNIKITDGIEEQNYPITLSSKNLAYTGWAQDFVSRIGNVDQAELLTYDNKNCLKFRNDAGEGDYDNKYMLEIDWNENTQYTFVFDLLSVSGYFNFSIDYTDGTVSFINGTQSANQWRKVIWTTDANKTVRRLRARNVTGLSYVDLDTFMVLEGVYTAETIPDYEPYYNIEYCKIGDYADQIFKNTTNSPYYDNTLLENEWYLKKNINKVTFDGSESGWVLSDTTRYAILIEQAIERNAFCNYFTYVNYKTYDNTPSPSFGINPSMTYIGFHDKTITSLNAFKTWLSTHNTKVYYPLATPTYIHISQADYPVLRSQLENLYNNAKSYNGQTNITQTNDGLPFNISVDVKVANL